MSKIPKLRFKEFSENWEEKTLKSISELISYGLTVRPEYLESGIPLISARELKGGKINYDMAPKISENSYNILSSKAKANKGDIFLTKTGTIGLSAYVDVDFSIAITQNISVIRVDNKLYNHQFILQTFKTKQFNKHIMQKVNQSTIMDLQLQDIRKSLISLPQKQEQEKIASFLTSVDTKIEQLTKKETLLKEYKKGVMQKIFNQEIRFKADDGSGFCEWEEKKLKEIGKFSAGGDLHKLDYSKEKDKTYLYPIYANGVGEGIYGYAKTFQYKSNCVTVSGRGNLGYANERKEKFNAIVRLIVIEPNKNINCKFLEETINNMNFAIESTGVPQLTVPQISIYKIRIPCLEEQTKIASFLSSLDTKIEKIQKQLEQTKEFKKALLQQMFV